MICAKFPIINIIEPGPSYRKRICTRGGMVVSAPDPFHTCAEKGVEYTLGKGLAI